jgi:predicted Zn-dependent peptidase
MDIQTFTFPNGIRLIHKQVPFTQIAHCGFVLDIGSRDEKPHQQGIAHFWEHMAFKGTKKRKAFHILNRLEAVGGELNAHTTKEKVCFYASLLAPHFEKAVELLTDITFESIFPENQIERERNVILEEMAMYLDSPDDAIQDEFDSLIFDQHSLGYNTLGTTESVSSFKREDFKTFVQENINTHRIIFSSVSNLPFAKVLKITEKYLTNIPEQKAEKKRLLFENYTPKQLQKTNSATQAHCAIGRTAFSLTHSKRLIFFMINNILGGPSMNSRLNLALREKYGYVYSIESGYHPFTDTGLFAIYFATEPKHLSKSISIVQKELKNLRQIPLGSSQLHQAKEQLLGQLAMAEESNLSFMLMMGNSTLDLGGIEPLEDIFAKIRQVTAQELQETAEEMLQEADLSTLIYLPEQN